LSRYGTKIALNPASLDNCFQGSLACSESSLQARQIEELHTGKLVEMADVAGALQRSKAELESFITKEVRFTLWAWLRCPRTLSLSG
jgi:hypothetical protein